MNTILIWITKHWKFILRALATLRSAIASRFSKTKSDWYSSVSGHSQTTRSDWASIKKVIEAEKGVTLGTVNSSSKPQAGWIEVRCMCGQMQDVAVDNIHSGHVDWVCTKPGCTEKKTITGITKVRYGNAKS